MTEHIPLGQPILVGHHSERGHRRVLERADNAMRAGCESESMANHHEAKAEGIQRQLDTCIFSDDPDAVEQLQAKIAREEHTRDVMKRVNVIIRQKPKNEQTPAKLAAIVALGIPELRAVELFKPDFAGRIGFPSYAITNIGANIRRMQERVAQITRDAERRTAAENATGGVLIEGDEWVRVTFSEKPDRDILTALKAAGFRWGQGSWVGKRESIPQDVLDMASEVAE
jgi:hypothetical protein